MVDVRTVKFTEALSVLQSLLGEDIRVMINFYGTLCGAYIEGPLLRIETLKPDDTAVNLVIGEGDGIILDPIGLEEILLGGELDSGGSIGFHLLRRVEISIQRPPTD